MSVVQSVSIVADDAAVPVVSTGASFLVGAFFSFRTFIMLLSVRLLGTSPQTGTGISVALNFLLLVVVAFETLGSRRRGLSWLLAMSPVRWVLAFLIFSGLSLFWTIADSQLAAVAYWCAMTADVAMLTLLSTSADEVDRIHALMKGYVWGACLVAAIAWLLPAQSDLRLGDEELLGANQIGYLCGFAFFFAQYLLREKVAKFGIAAAFLGITLLRSLSKTTIIAFIVAEAILLLRDTTISRKRKLALLVAATAVIVTFSSLLSSYVDLYANTGNSPETLTGRIGIWAFIFAEAIKQPWVGHGFYSVWKVIPPFGDFEARHAHNELLQQFYLYGAIGVLFMAGLYGSFFRKIRRTLATPQRIFMYSLLVFVLIRGLADTEVYDFSLPLWAIIMFSVLMKRADVRDPGLPYKDEGNLWIGETADLSSGSAAPSGRIGNRSEDPLKCHPIVKPECQG
jgi:O-antigen ligase